MKSTRWISMFLIAVVLAMPAFAEEWKKGTKKSCSTKGDSLYCLIDQTFTGPTTRLTVKTSLPNVKFTYAAWHSVCGFGGGKVEEQNFSAIDSGTEIVIQVLDPGTGISCREAFIQTCTVNNKAIACSTALEASAQSYVGNR